MRIRVAETAQGPHGEAGEAAGEAAVRSESSALCDVLVPLEITLFLRGRTGRIQWERLLWGVFCIFIYAYFLNLSSMHIFSL